MIAVIVGAVLLVGLVVFVLVRQSDGRDESPRPIPSPGSHQIRLFVQTDKEGDELDALLADARQAQDIIQRRMREALDGREFRFVNGVRRLRKGTPALSKLQPNEKAAVWIDRAPPDPDGPGGGGAIGGRVAFVYLDFGARLWHRWQREQTNFTGGRREAAMIHEIFHTLGIVPEDAPNVCGNHHVCHDKQDIMYEHHLGGWEMDRGGEDYRQLLLDSPYIKER